MASSSKTICKAFRVVVCAAILTGSLFGRALHSLHHQLDHALRSLAVAELASSQEQVGQETTHRCHSHPHAAHGGHSHAVSSGCPGQPSPSEPDEHQHDSGNCAVCYALSLELDRSESVSLQPVALHIDEVVDLADDVAVEQCRFSASARGPPFEA